ncbi:hypothetical protein BGZ96_002145, partial [Linnemannia gamsii]
MEDTQSFRLIETMNTVEITPKHVDGQNIVYWEDIEQVFPGVKYVKDGKVAINIMRDSDGIRIVPHRIEHRPGVVLDVVLSTTVEHALVDSPISHSRLVSTDGQGESPTHAPFDSHLPGIIIKELNVNPPANSTAPVSLTKSGFERTVIDKLNGLYGQGAIIHQIALEVCELQKQINNRLILIQSKTEAILTQQLELTEYKIPRLFIVLPDELAKYDPGNWFRTKFRLHFICECGKHTEAINSKVPHHLHLAKHEGYLIRQPTEFFKKYGPFLLLMLELIKCGTSIAGFVVPALASLKIVELSVKQSVELVTAKINYSLKCIDNQLVKVQASSPGDSIDTELRAAMTQQDLTNYLSDVEGLEGVELRQLESFLKTSSKEKLFGNLYRMTTSEGHVKWVCHDHHHDGYQEKYTQKLRDVVKLAKGEFDEQLGRITIALTSSFAATEFYNAVRKAKGVLELIMDWDWKDLRLPQTKPGCACKMSYELAPKLIQGREFRMLAETLKTNLTLTTLNLYNNSIGSDGAK